MSSWVERWLMLLFNVISQTMAWNIDFQCSSVQRFDFWGGLDRNVSVLRNEFKLSLKGLGNFCQLCVLLAWDKIKALARYQIFEISVLFQSFSFLYLFCRSGYEAQGVVAVRQALSYWATPLIQSQVFRQHKKWAEENTSTD